MSGCLPLAGWTTSTLPLGSAGSSPGGETTWLCWPPSFCPLTARLFGGCRARTMTATLSTKRVMGSDQLSDVSGFKSSRVSPIGCGSGSSMCACPIKFILKRTQIDDHIDLIQNPKHENTNIQIYWKSRQGGLKIPATDFFRHRCR